MTLAEAARELLAATESGDLEDLDGPIAQLQQVLASPNPLEAMASALQTLKEAQKAVSVHHSDLVSDLLELERSALYLPRHRVPATSWELSA